MKSDVWMPLYIGDYSGDTIGLSLAQHGAYLLAIMAYWRKQGPLTDSELKEICQDQFERVSRFFHQRTSSKADSNETIWTHKRIDREIMSSELRKKTIQNRAKSGAMARWKDAKAMPKQCPSNTQAMPKYAYSQVTSHNSQPQAQPQPPSHSMRVVGEKGGTGGEGEVESGLDDIPKSDGALEMQKRISIAFARKGPWTRTEEEALLEVVMRPQCFEEVDRVLRFRESCPAALKQVEGVAAVRQLLQHWTDILDKVNAGYRPGRTSRKQIEQDRAAAREDAAWKREYEQIMSMPEPKIGAP